MAARKASGNPKAAVAKPGKAPKTPAPASGKALPAAQRNEATIRRLYDALDRKDGDAMAACYAPDATFTDPAFGELRGPQVGGMWRMLTARATDLRVLLDYVQADGNAASARWVAEYTFAATGRRVRNVGEATFAMRDGLIRHHVDAFPFWRWSRQALGAPGWLLGWTPVLRSKVRANARRQLERFLAD
jgi:ketosteroid isomerase-like protein